MHKSVSILLVISVLLLTSCNTKLTPANEKMVEPPVGKSNNS